MAISESDFELVALVFVERTGFARCACSSLIRRGRQFRMQRFPENRMFRVIAEGRPD
jgi:hypothetical protein